MIWVLAGAAVLILLGLELRRVVRDRLAERDGPHLYAGYTADDPDHAAALVEVAAGDPLPDGPDEGADGDPARAPSAGTQAQAPRIDQN